MEQDSGQTAAAHEDERGPMKGQQQTSTVLDKSEELLLKMASTLELMNKSLKRQCAEPISVPNKKLRVDEAQAGTSSSVTPRKGQSTSAENQTSALADVSSDVEDHSLDSEDESLSLDDLFKDNDSPDEKDESDDDLVGELDAFFEEQQETGQKVTSAKLATVANRSLKFPVDEEKMKEIRKKYKRPENVEYLQTPTVDHFIWRQLPREVRNVDVQLQKAVGQMVHCLIPLVQAIEHMDSNKKLSRTVMKPLILDAFKMMAHSVACNNKARRDKIKSAVMPKFRNMIQQAKPSATLLFGDKIKEEIKVLNEKSTSITATSTNRQPFLRKRGGPSQYNKTKGTPYYRQNTMRPKKQWYDRQANQHYKKFQGGKTSKK